MVDTFLLPVGQRLADACPISADDRVLDVDPRAARGRSTPADQLVRVCRPGGTIGLLSWTRRA